MSGGSKFEYLWQDGTKYKKPTHLPAPQYISLLMDWVETQINDEMVGLSQYSLEFTHLPFPSSYFLSRRTFHFLKLSSLNARRFWRGSTESSFMSTFTTLIVSWASGRNLTLTPATNTSTTSSLSLIWSMRRSSLPCKRWQGRSVRTSLHLRLQQARLELTEGNLLTRYFSEPHKPLFPPDSGGASGQR